MLLLNVRNKHKYIPLVTPGRDGMANVIAQTAALKKFSPKQGCSFCNINLLPTTRFFLGGLDFYSSCNSYIKYIPSYFEILKRYLAPLFCPSLELQPERRQTESCFNTLLCKSHTSLFSTLWSASSIWMSNSSALHLPPQPFVHPIIFPCWAFYRLFIYLFIFKKCYSPLFSILPFAALTHWYISWSPSHVNTYHSLLSLWSSRDVPWSKYF